MFVLPCFAQTGQTTQDGTASTKNNDWAKLRDAAIEIGWPLPKR